jgi:hypothetical protein
MKKYRLARICRSIVSSFCLHHLFLETDRRHRAVGEMQKDEG